MATTGRIHSLESFGAVDGPGIRYVVFFQGCPLRCIYCHNPDTWPARGGREMTVEELVETILPYKLFLRRGGVTLTGGEPLAQSGFVHELIDALHTHGLHVAIDTAGSIPLDQCRPAVDAADMLLLDIKALDAGLCRIICGSDGSRAKALLEYCQGVRKPVWLRHVVVPDYTLDEKRLRELAAYLKPFTCIERVELLPFHQMGSYKWAAEKLPYALQDKRTPTQEEMENARKIFSDAGLKVQ
ncbi:MAG TPA: pyruvate formate lyase-activating protein [Firmicutes bacterium]|nr:pyruvate formate lyase-activating protein [Bacillota bacterium]